MDNFMIFAVGTLFGALLGAVGMLLLIKETRLDLAMEQEPEVEFYAGGEPVAHCKPTPAPVIDWDDDVKVPFPEEVEYGNF